MSPRGKRWSADQPRPTEQPRLVARALLIALAVFLPFEAPILSIGPLTITTVELVLYLLLAAWVTGFVVQQARAGARSVVGVLSRATIASAFRDPIARAVTLWLAVIVVSALVAPAQRVPALKFALRALGGGLLFFAARGLMRSAADARAVALGILMGALLSAAGGVVESVFPNTAAVWHPFRAATFSVTGLPRPSGPFGYPTIAAMYWEAALPLAIALPLCPRDPQREINWVSVALAIAGAGVLIMATLFSATRTALVAAPLGCVAMVVFTWRRGRLVRTASCGTLALVAVLAGATLASPGAESPLTMRLRWWQDGNWYRVRYTVGQETLTMPAGSFEEVPVTLQNTGRLIWPNNGPDAVHLSYHWESHDSAGAHLDFEGRRSALPSDIAPEETAQILADVRAPDKPGRYRLRWDLVRENVLWFSERGNPTADQEVEVVVAGARNTKRRARSSIVDSSLEDWLFSEVPTRPELWRAAYRLWLRHPVLGVGPDNFRHLYPQVISLGRKNPTGAFDERMHANSLYFETLADLGLVGMLALGLLMAALGRAAWRRVAALALPLTVACAVGVGTFFIHGVLDCFWAFTPTYGLYWLLMALLVASEEPPLTPV